MAVEDTKKVKQVSLLIYSEIVHKFIYAHLISLMDLSLLQSTVDHFHCPQKKFVNWKGKFLEIYKLSKVLGTHYCSSERI